jgi:4-hydroxybenzoate polyprenyltransferase/phosphoserine phosphatase
MHNDTATPERAQGGPVALVVDLDGTLIATDSLWESFWITLARAPRAGLVAALALLRGRAAFKRALAPHAPPPESWPLRPEVQAEIAAARARGQRVILASAADSGIVLPMVAHLGLDQGLASDGRVNLKGEIKARALQDACPEGFSYIGDARADLPVWQAALRSGGEAVSVAASPALCRALQALDASAAPRIRHIGQPPALAAAALRALRLHQWLKNLLIFVPILAAHRLDESYLAAMLAFWAFGMAASAVYLLNDLLDLGPDRAHPRKRDRAIASGALPLVWAMAMIPLLLLAALGVALVLGWPFVVVLLGYLSLTSVYSLALKRRVVVDIVALGVLYAMRLVAGAAAVDAHLSLWLLAFSFFFFFALAAIKRLAELIDQRDRGVMETLGRGYSVADLPVISQMASAAGFVAVLVMVLYLYSPEVMALYRSPMLLWGASLVLLYWFARVLLLTHRGQMHDDPVVFAFKDGVSLSCFLVIAALVVGAVL